MGPAIKRVEKVRKKTGLVGGLFLGEPSSKKNYKISILKRVGDLDNGVDKIHNFKKLLQKMTFLIWKNPIFIFTKTAIN